MKQSSIEWLIEQLTEVERNLVNKTFLQNNKSMAGYKLRELFEQAKAMHKEEIVDSIVQYMIKHHNVFSETAILNTTRKAEEYYEKTFNTKEK